MYLLAIFGILAAQAQKYQLQNTFFGLSFFDNFDFYTSWDPTFGYVHYVDRTTAEQHDMIHASDSSASWGVETTQILDPNANLGRLSIRLTSVQSWTHGLFIIDLAHMPDNTCGSWPAMWMLGGGTWPQGGEIDIIEVVNNVPNDLMAMHTTPGCTVAGANETGTLITSDCGAGDGYTGCTVSANAADNAGNSFNADGGGVYAMEWTSSGVRIWYFARNNIPTSITSEASPDVDTWAVPAASFEGSCDFDAHLFDHRLGWQSCNDFVALNPHAFDETYWEVNYVKIYEALPGSSPTSTTSLPSVTPAIVTSSAVSTALSNAEGRSTTPVGTLAGTTPDVTTGSFTATSSVLSVLSSLSTESQASVSSVSATLTSATSAGSQTLTSAAASTDTGAPLPTTPSAPSFTSTSSSSSDTSCTGDVCTIYTSVIVVQTVTVNAQIALATNVEARRDLATTTFLQGSPTASHPQLRVREQSSVDTILCANVEGPPAAWTTSYEDPSWWILACAESPFPADDPPQKRGVYTTSNLWPLSSDAAATKSSTTISSLLINASPSPTVSQYQNLQTVDESSAAAPLIRIFRVMFGIFLAAVLMQ